jgi:hypothetical protein
MLLFNKLLPMFVLPLGWVLALLGLEAEIVLMQQKKAELFGSCRRASALR